MESNEEDAREADPGGPEEADGEAVATGVADSCPFGRSRRTPRTPTKATERCETRPSEGQGARHRAVSVKRLIQSTLRRSLSVGELIAGPDTQQRTQKVSIETPERFNGTGCSSSDKRKLSPPNTLNENKRAKINTVVPPIERASAKLELLSELALTHPTTARKIKETITDLKRDFAEAIKQMADLQDELNSLKKQQTNNPAADKINEKINPDMTKEDIRALIASEWPQEVFIKTTFNPKEWGKEAMKTRIRTTLLYPGNFRNDPNFLRVASTVPEIRELTTETFIKHGKIVIERNETTSITGGNGEMKSSCTILQPAALSEIGELDVADGISWANNIKEAAKSGAVLFEASIPEGLDPTALRKIMECCLRGTSAKMIIKLSRGQRARFQPRVPRPHTESEFITVRAKEGVLYSQIVKEMKKNINPDELGVDIKKLTNTLSGNVRIQVTEKIPGAKNAMIERINSTVTLAEKATLSQKTKGIVLMDLDTDTTEEDIQVALESSLGLEPGTARVNPTRNMNRGTLMATAFLPVEAALRAIKERRIKVGWSYCHVKERTEPPFCNKCQVYGHLTKDCKETVIHKRRCLRCGDEHHRTFECKSDTEKCFSCNTSGHRANSMKCPVYKALVNAKRQ